MQNMFSSQKMIYFCILKMINKILNVKTGNFNGQGKIASPVAQVVWSLGQ